MLRIVLPVIAPTAGTVASVDVIAIASVYVVSVAPIYVAVTIEIVIVVDRDVVVAAPTAAPTPTSANGCSNHHSYAKRNGRSCRVISRGRVVDWWVGIHGSAINDYRVVAGNVDDLRIGLLNHNDTLAFHNLCFYLHLLGAF